MGRRGRVLFDFKGDIENSELTVSSKNKNKKKRMK
jgi:hypothetical protein